MQPSPRNTAVLVQRPAACTSGAMLQSQGCLNEHSSGQWGGTSTRACSARGCAQRRDTPVYAQLWLSHDIPSSHLSPQLQHSFEKRLWRNFEIH